jgi:hypothetical protein
MNIRKGLFRLWVVGSVLFVIVFASLSYGGLRNEFRLQGREGLRYQELAQKYGGTLVVELPVECLSARGVPNQDYKIHDDLCWYETLTFRHLYPEYKDLSDHDLEVKLHDKVGRPIPHQHPWLRVWETIGIALGVPFGVLLIGFSVLWAFTGFRKDSE